MSSTLPLASIARQSQYFRPQIGMTTSSRCHLSAATGLSRLMQPAKWTPQTVYPFPDRFPADHHTPSGEKILDIRSAEREAMVDPDGICHDLTRKTVAFQAGHGGRYIHTQRLTRHRSANKLAIPLQEALRRQVSLAHGLPQFLETTFAQLPDAFPRNTVSRTETFQGCRRVVELRRDDDVAFTIWQGG